MSITTPLSPTRDAVTPNAVRAPRRFDTHNARAVGHLLAQQDPGRSGQLVLDGSDVVFADRDAVGMLVATGLGRTGGLRIEHPSLALQITLELLGHQLAPMGRAA